MDMHFLSQRKLLFKAWNTETRLLMRLDNIDCVKGALYKKNHILLPFTGMHDKAGDELYEMDVVLAGTGKFVIVWDGNPIAWQLVNIADNTILQPLTQAVAETVVRLCCYFESEKK
jgi:hypothetical protein